MNTEQRKRYIYVFSPDQFKQDFEKFNAGTKCPSDAVRTVMLNGGEYHYFDYLTHKVFWRFVRLPALAFKMLFIPKRGSQIIVMYPYNTDHPTFIGVFRLVRPLLHLKKVKTVAFIVDINSIRFDEGDIQDDIVPLNVFDYVLVHSKAMEDLLKSNGLRSRTEVFELMDYHVMEKNTLERTLSYNVCFAGNLKKSVFLSTLSSLSTGKLHLYLYGAGYSESICPEWASYEGIFTPDSLDGIKGSWGLVWDGDSIDGVSGYLGRYMVMNAPHKASMYICIGLPLIAPEGTNTGDMVKKYGLGLTVSSLAQMEGAIAAVSVEEYRRLLSNVKTYSERLMKGQNLLDALKAVD